MNGFYYFISDVHLGLQSEQIEKIKEDNLVSLLYFMEGKADKLFILGDLFDYWFEYRKVIQKGYFKVFTAVEHLVKSGTEVHYLIGNHDFLHRDFFSRYIGAIVHKDSVTIELDGKKFFLGHGDGLVKNDTGYKILKMILRNRFLQWAFSLIHPDFGIYIGSKSSKKSRDYTSSKDYGDGDGLFETAKDFINSGYDYVLFGHSHIRKFESYRNGVYVNLGSWLTNPCYGVFSNGNFEIKDWKGNGQ